ncbi:MAG: hypothetical protein OXG97_20745 [Candidatus Poribacteria bacterium]|nr:hypothetical protein [Candidatus Poribacteria bacterium]
MGRFATLLLPSLLLTYKDGTEDGKEGRGTPCLPSCFHPSLFLLLNTSASAGLFSLTFNRKYGILIVSVMGLGFFTRDTWSPSHPDLAENRFH